MLKKLPVGILVFLFFAISGIGVAEVLHQKSQGESESLEESSQILGTVNGESKTNLSQTVQSTSSTSGSSKNKSEDDDKKISSTSKHGEDDEGEEESENESEDDRDGLSQQATSPTPPPVSSSTSANPTSVATFTMAQVAKHNSSSSCYTAIDGSVYDVTVWISQHPGGSAAILSLCGIDGSSAFNGQHGGQTRPASELASFKIGLLTN